MGVVDGTFEKSENLFKMRVILHHIVPDIVGNAFFQCMEFDGAADFFLTSTLRHQIWFFRFKACTHYGISQSIQNESSNNGSISLCVGVRNIVLEITVDEFSNLTWIVVTVFAASNTLSTLISMPASLIRLSSSL